MTVQGAGPRVRRRTLVLGSLAVGVISLCCAIRWEAPFLILSAMGLAWPVFLLVPHFEEIMKSRARLALELPIAAILFFFSARLLCLPIVGLHILLWAFLASERRNRWLNATAIAFLLVMSLPVDMDMGSFHGPHYGVVRSGPRFVRFVMGMPRMHRCVELYGEFISGGCCVMGNEPRWLFVWEEAGMGKPASAVGRLPRSPIHRENAEAK